MNRKREISRRLVPSELEQSLPQDMHPVLRRVFAARHLDPESVNTSLSSLIPVSQMDHSAEAAERLADARKTQQHVLVLGDFDADGATATALMMTCLHAFGFKQSSFLVPDRQAYGYGLSAPIVALAAASSPDVIVTVDNGISSHAGVEAANNLGIDVVITDHHLPGETLPDAAVIVNPNAPDNHFPSKVLAGVGVAFYVMAALGQRLEADGLIDVGEARKVCTACLDLVALGTIADLVPLDRNNRVLVAQGMARIRSGNTRPGIKALFSVAGRNISAAATSDLGFALGPRLNAAGRLTDMTIGINCLLAENDLSALKLANELSQLNQQRRELQTQMQLSAEVQLDGIEAKFADQMTDAVCLFDSSWHQGVVGLVATRIKERVNRPVIAFAPAESAGQLKGSGRSVPGVHLRDVLAAVDASNPGLIRRYGGHAMAAGLSLDKANFEVFTQAFTQEVAKYAEQIEDIERLWSDGELLAADINLNMAETLRHAAPWGQGFPEPSFDGCFELIDQRIVGKQHLKLRVKPAGGMQPIDAIAFNQPEILSVGVGQEVKLVYRLDINEFRANRSHQLVVQHIECV
ncbi:MAG: single-stranded-DNA-specific exonuclease RecJ [Gammaproteobacteria bacterium]|nr:single-stranded-DNA-specific exonuclease RecJ [Gammaproteobacteria bacterium]MCP4088814.1 single-stranded-DNA-specific exonuclease RecJ [Gammaproteobacteria bacterium]MCP4275887.1 single-stranded-DNA-specific exonuclease RecJ [Gammaproteobacteria bacterium]MCP4832103.1 single-stranded-DNA-specific exonuclease RecJ [Gammaproteobacteria bacterium]MCP4928296.1 single-stranded-DNA-specific exonuclease RecJ [Gammaproteobacteria bacterium]